MPLLVTALTHSAVLVWHLAQHVLGHHVTTRIERMLHMRINRNKPSVWTRKVRKLGRPKAAALRQRAYR